MYTIASHTIKIQNFDHQNWSDFFLYKNLFFFATLNWYLNATFQLVGSYMRVFTVLL